MIYQDEKCIAYLAEEPAAPGHVVLTPKEKYTILEEVPEAVVGHLFVIANKLSSILFETMGAQGTNTIINNGVGQKEPQVLVHIIPRKEKDGLPLQWEGQGDTEPHNVAFLKLKDACAKIFPGKEKQEPMQAKKKESKAPEMPEERNVDWIEKALFRLP